MEWRELVAGIIGAVICIALYWRVSRDDAAALAELETPDLVRDLDTFRRRVQRDDVVTCHGRIRKPLAARNHQIDQSRRG